MCKSFQLEKKKDKLYKRFIITTITTAPSKCSYLHLKKQIGNIYCEGTAEFCFICKPLLPSTFILSK